MIAGVVGVTIGVFALTSGGAGPAVALPVLMVAGAALAAAFRRHAAAKLKAEQICGEATPRPLMDTLLKIERRLASVEHRTRARHPVTDLPTREHLHERMAADIEGGAKRCLLGVIRLADFDRLATFDPEVAHAALASFAARLRAALPQSRLISHTDRDCFSVWFPCDAETAMAEFRALLYVAGQELDHERGVLSPTVRAASFLYPDDGRDPVQLVVRSTATVALAASEGEGELSPRGRALVAPPTAKEAQARYGLEQALTRAVDLDQLTLVYQPVVDLNQPRVIGAEALLRWSHPELGSISPGVFIPVAEQIGLSDRLGLWVLNAACREAAAWRTEGLVDLKVAVNLSARQLLDPDLSGKVRRTLQRHDLPAQSLELELTETAAMKDAERTRQLFSSLRRAGVSLAIDDFGSGYSSLSYLKTLPFDKLKIDREFVSGVDASSESRAICRALIELGRGLGLVVLAEGVEEAREVAALRALGCAVFQGFHLSKPLSGAAFRSFVRTSSWSRADLAAPSSLPAPLEGLLAP